MHSGPINRRGFLTGLLATPVVFTGVKAGWIQPPRLVHPVTTTDWAYKHDRMVWTRCWFDDASGTIRFEEIPRKDVYDGVPSPGSRNIGNGPSVMRTAR